ncbi:PREDICTED: translocator protein homolog [Ipomoea nil]|uniref:translocator protein homolog n=1 Tax=Ipomoea nil TaxID=35883 RepID=UPI000901EED2|nr:PREDICTED: translocator protein homolog [Ipomoea nil]
MLKRFWNETVASLYKETPPPENPPQRSFVSLARLRSSVSFALSSILPQRYYHLISMATQQLKHRTTTTPEEREQFQPTTTQDTAEMNSTARTRRQRAKRGLRSLGIAVAFPLSLTLLDITLFGSSQQYRAMEKPFWVPRLWALHLACLGSAFLMGLSAWLVWAEGGFHRYPTAMLLYLCQLALSLAWDPVVFKAGATRAGLVLCVGLLGALVGCSRSFKNVNPIAGDLVKPCLGWALLLSATNFKLAYI